MGSVLNPAHYRTLMLLVLFAAATARVASANEVSFDQAIALASEAPSVRATAEELSVRNAQDKELPSNRGPLTISLTPGQRLSPSAESGVEVQLGIMQGWNLGDLAGHSRKAARAERAVLATQVRARALAAKIDVAQRWFQLHRAESALAIVRDELAVVAELDQANRRAKRAGLITSVAEAEAMAAHAEAKRLERYLEGERVSAALALSAAFGTEPDSELRAHGPLPKPELPPAARIADLSKRVDLLPRVALLRLQSVAALARATETRASYGRRLGVGASVQRESTGSTLVFGTVQVSFSGANRGQRAEAISHAESRRRTLQAEGLSVSLRAEMAEAVHELEHSEEVWQLVSKELEPASEELLRRRMRELELGEGTVIEVLRARARLLSARRMSAEANAERRWAQVHIWLLLAEILVAADEKETK